MTPPRRQWGAERRSAPMSMVHPAPSQRSMTLGRVAITVTIGAWIAYIVTTILRQFVNDGQGFRFTMEAASYMVVVTLLTFSALMYLVARQGALYRFADHRRVPRGELDRHFAQRSSAITVLVPSYAEEPEVVRSTLWSAALQEFPSTRVVLLIDDPPFPGDEPRRQRLEATRALTAEIEGALAEPHAHLTAAFARYGSEGEVSLGEVRALADDYAYAAEWLEAMGSAEPVHDHVSEFFVEQVIGGLASDLRLTHTALWAAVGQGETLPRERVEELRRRLLWIFSAEVTSFERKRYASLSHEANKAMNINAYISLMGRRLRIVETGGQEILQDVAADEPADLEIPDTEYLLTLDADSLLLRDYCLRLVYLLEEPEHARVAVAQTPYSSFRGAPTRLERIAGATTDVQHILHQGMSYYGATFWVGANAVIRKAALEDIVQVETVGGHEIKTYVQDRTVIEDTESSIDLGTAGWSLINYPERLSYSATPPDFGALIVQRRRWANGGLLILSKLSEQLRVRRGRGERVLRRELMLRINYMASIAWASFALMFLLFYPYDSRLLSPLVLLAALPYFLAMGYDLRACGHRFTDIFRIYGLNLVLLAVNLAGVLKSIQQAFTGRKIPFARTPKVRDRTLAPGRYILFPLAIVAFSIFTAQRDFAQENWGNFAFATFNAATCLYAIRAYIGLRHSLYDTLVGAIGWLFVERDAPAQQATPVVAEAGTNWRAMLYEGDRRLTGNLRKENDRRRRLRSR